MKKLKNKRITIVDLLIKLLRIEAKMDLRLQK